MTEMVRYAIEHMSRYRYRKTVSRSAMWLCLEPRSDFDQNVRRFEVVTEPASISAPKPTHSATTSMSSQLTSNTILSSSSPGQRSTTSPQHDFQPLSDPELGKKSLHG